MGDPPGCRSVARRALNRLSKSILTPASPMPTPPSLPWVVVRRTAFTVHRLPQRLIERAPLLIEERAAPPARSNIHQSPPSPRAIDDLNSMGTT